MSWLVGRKIVNERASKIVRILYSRAKWKFDLSSEVMLKRLQIIAPINSPPQVNGSIIAAHTTANIDASMFLGITCIIIEVHGIKQNALKTDLLTKKTKI